MAIATVLAITTGARALHLYPHFAARETRNPNEFA
jgi:hypothetical protein